MISVNVEMEDLELFDQGSVVMMLNAPVRMKIKSDEDDETLEITFRVIFSPQGGDEVKTDLVSDRELDVNIFYNFKSTRIGTKKPIFLGEIEEQIPKELHLMFDCEITDKGRAILSYNWFMKVKG